MTCLRTALVTEGDSGTQRTIPLGCLYRTGLVNRCRFLSTHAYRPLGQGWAAVSAVTPIFLAFRMRTSRVKGPTQSANSATPTTVPAPLSISPTSPRIWHLPRRTSQHFDPLRIFLIGSGLITRAFIIRLYCVSSGWGFLPNAAKGFNPGFEGAWPLLTMAVLCVVSARSLS
jgi:hypothetical protein